MEKFSSIIEFSQTIPLMFFLTREDFENNPKVFVLAGDGYVSSFSEKPKEKKIIKSVENLEVTLSDYRNEYDKDISDDEILIKESCRKLLSSTLFEARREIYDRFQMNPDYYEKKIKEELLNYAKVSLEANIYVYKETEEEKKEETEDGKDASATNTFAVKTISSYWRTDTNTNAAFGDQTSATQDMIYSNNPFTIKYGDYKLNSNNSFSFFDGMTTNTREYIKTVKLDNESLRKFFEKISVNDF